MRSPPLWVLFLAVVGLRSPVFAREALPETFTYQEMKDLIRGQGIRNLDQLLMWLPDSLRGHFALVYDSRSAQPASPQDPRVLLFRPDAKLLFAFSSQHSDSLEILEWNSLTGHYEPRLIRFQDEVQFVDDPNLSLAHSPQACFRCHGAQARPIWDAYPRWPGVFGHADKMNERSAPFENRNLQELKAKIGAEGLLRHLPGIQDVSLKILGRRHSLISDQMSKLNAQRIVGLLRRSPLFSRYRAAFFAALMNHPRFDYFLTPSERREFRQQSLDLENEYIRHQRAYREQLNRRQKSGGEEATSVELLDEAFATAPPRLVVRVMFLSRQMGVSMRDWWTTLEPWTFATGTGNRGLWRELIPPFVAVLKEMDSEIIGELELKERGATFYFEKWRPVIQAIQERLWRDSGVSQKFPPWYSPAGIQIRCLELLVSSAEREES